MVDTLDGVSSRVPHRLYCNLSSFSKKALDGSSDAFFWPGNASLSKGTEACRVAVMFAKELICFFRERECVTFGFKEQYYS